MCILCCVKRKIRFSQVSTAFHRRAVENVENNPLRTVEFSGRYGVYAIGRHIGGGQPSNGQTIGDDRKRLGIDGKNHPRLF